MFCYARIVADLENLTLRNHTGTCRCSHDADSIFNLISGDLVSAGHSPFHNSFGIPLNLLAYWR